MHTPEDPFPLDGGERQRSPRARDREATEAALLKAALQLLREHGVLAGLNLQEVAEVAGVNRGLIYQYFGSRRDLLRTALSKMPWAELRAFGRVRELPFRQRRVEVFRQSLSKREHLRLKVLLVLDGDPESPIFPALSEARKDLQRDIDSGELPPDADALVMHLMSGATYYGYAVLRDVIAKEAQIDPEELDTRAAAVFQLMIDGMASSGGHCPSEAEGEAD